MHLADFQIHAYQLNTVLSLNEEKLELQWLNCLSPVALMGERREDKRKKWEGPYGQLATVFDHTHIHSNTDILTYTLKSFLRPQNSTGYVTGFLMSTQLLEYVSNSNF